MAQQTKVPPDDRSKRIEALYRLEIAAEPTFYKPWVDKPMEYVYAHIYAAHYLVQSMGGGVIPDNFDEIIAESDRCIEVEMALREAK